MKRMKFKQEWVDQAVGGIVMSPTCQFFWQRSIKNNISSLPLNFLSNENLFKHMINFYAVRHIEVIDGSIAQAALIHKFDPYSYDLDDTIKDLYRRGVWTLSGNKVLQELGIYFNENTYPQTRLSFLSDALFPTTNNKASNLLNTGLGVMSSIIQSQNYQSIKPKFEKPQLFPEQVLQKLIGSTNEENTLKIFSARPEILKKMLGRGHKSLNYNDYAHINWNIIGPVTDSTVMDKRWHAKFYSQFTGFKSPPKCVAPFDWVNVLVYSLFSKPDFILELQPILDSSKPMGLWGEPV